MDRKNFLKTCYGAALGASSTFLLGACGGLYYARSEKVGSRLVIDRSEFVQIRGDKKLDRSFVLIAMEDSDHPICLYNIDHDKYQAALLKCTHRGCTLDVGGGIYSCPCHGSEFALTGKVLEGPAERDLHMFQTEVDDEFIIIHLS